MILIILTYLAGVLTILSPCILPVLPFVFARSQQSFLKSGVPLLAGMSLTFSIFSALAIVGGEWIAQANEAGRYLAMVMLSIFGISLIFPILSEKLMAPLMQIGGRIGGSSKGNSIGSSFLIGISTGLLWAPCAGPILGLVLTGAAVQGNVGASIGLLLSYSLGAATSLALALVAGGKFLQTLKSFLGVDQLVKKVMGVAVLGGVIIIAFNLDRTVLTKISKLETSSIEYQLLNLVAPKKTEDISSNSMIIPAKTKKKEKIIEGILPELTGAVSWLNSQPLSKAQLLGKVVLIDFWTYSCINCLRTLPYVKAWAEKYKNEDFIVIGIHTPEFGFEKNPANVEKAVKELGISYPIAIDNDYSLWNAFQNQYWPAHYFIDRKGQIRYHHFGEGNYEESDKMIHELLIEDGANIKSTESRINGEGIQAASIESEVKSPETYVGYGRAENFIASTGVRNDQVAEYRFSYKLEQNQWSLNGKWLIAEEKAILKAAHGKVVFRFHARDLHLVVGTESTTAKPIKFRVSIDGHAPGTDSGIDINQEGLGEITSHRLYQLIRQKGEGVTADHTFEIEFFGTGVEVYAFTFG
jgi:cytochrome c biogenesis protein CcdA/thiol-disulfide isomerase/thioredoxin